MSTRPLARPAAWAVFGAALATAGAAWLRAGKPPPALRAGEAFQARPDQPRASVLIVGDSIAAGMGATTPQQSIAGLVAHLAPGIRVVNRASEGACYEDFIWQLQASDERFDIVLVLGGGNDAIRLTREIDLRAQVRRAVGLAHQRGDVVVLMPPGNLAHAPLFWAPRSWWLGRRSRMLHRAVRDAAQATAAVYVNLYKPAKDDPFVQRGATLHARDGLHPNDAGHAVWMQELDAQARLTARLQAKLQPAT